MWCTKIGEEFQIISKSPLGILILKKWFTKLGRISDRLEITSRYEYAYQLRNVVHNVYEFPGEKYPQCLLIWW